VYGSAAGCRGEALCVRGRQRHQHRTNVPRQTACHGAARGVRVGSAAVLGVCRCVWGKVVVGAQLARRRKGRQTGRRHAGRQTGRHLHSPLQRMFCRQQGRVRCNPLQCTYPTVHNYKNRAHNRNSTATNHCVERCPHSVTSPPTEIEESVVYCICEVGEVNRKRRTGTKS